MTGTGTGGAATNGAAAAGGTGAAGGDAAAAGGGAGAAVYDSEGNLISGGEGAVAGVATALPFTLASDGWGWQQSVMLCAVILLGAVVAIPPVLSPRLRRAKSSSTGVRK